MRPVLSALSLSVLAACTGPNTTTVPLDVNWMEWPAQVVAAQPFSVRLLVPLQSFCTSVIDLRVPATIDNSAVTFAPFELVRGEPVYCPVAASASVPVYPFPAARDTTVQVSGLATSYLRTYELRAAAEVFASTPTASALPERTFGTVTVRLDSATATHANAGGRAQITRDALGCTRVVPLGLFPTPGYVLENPDTGVVRLDVFVRGYLYNPVAPLCGAARVFHLVSVN